MGPRRAPEKIALALTRWYARNRRDLPWRRAPDPYRVLVSEVMLQQTTVETAAPYYERFVAAYPDVRTLARAREQDVLALWSGLGYYHRARRLRDAARAIVRRHRGRVPGDRDSLRRLPGVGPYTASAILAIAHSVPEVALDGNLRRVLARLAAVGEDVRSARGERSLLAAGRAIVAEGDPSVLNQAMMDLGAAVCLPRRPRCPGCPVERLCAARRLGLQEEIPPPPRRERTVPVTLGAAVLRRGGRMLLVRRAGPLMAGLWEFPAVEREGRARPADVAADLARVWGAERGSLRHAATLRHGITRHRVRIEVFEGGAPARARRAREASLPGEGPRAWRLAEAPARGGEERWVPAAGAASLPLTGIARKVLAVLSPDGRAAGKGGRGAAGLRPRGSGRSSSAR